MLRSLLLTFALAMGVGASAQTRAPDDPAPAATPAAPAAPAARGGIQGQNIFDVKPEVKPDASSDPDYMKQSNAERNRVQPGNNSPMWRGVAAGVEGFTSLPRSQAPEAGVLIQGQVQYPGSRLTTAGEAWRQVRNNWIIPYGGALLLIALGALAILYFGKGPLGHSANEGRGRWIERFTVFERAAHWANAIAFVILAISGIVMAFGRYFLLPIMGATLFGWLSYVLKNLHNFVGPLFAVSLVIIILTFIRDEFPRRGDLTWLVRLGGVFGKAGEEPPSHRFNAGEKVVFWIGVLFLGVIVVASGLVLDMLIPAVVYERSTMQIAHMIHAVSALLMMALLSLHIYLGTIGVRGAYRGMRTGYVDEEWAREHHAHWYADIQDGRIPAHRSSDQRVPADDVKTVRPA
jgi:formate dehydrogenase subunit gamma